MLLSIKTFLERNGYDLNELDALNIMKRLDVDKDSKITFNEFKRFFFNYLGEVNTGERHYYSSLDSFFDNNSNSYYSPIRRKMYGSPFRTTTKTYYSPLRETITMPKNTFSSRYASPLKRTNQILNSNGLNKSSSFNTSSPSKLRNTSRSPLRSTYNGSNYKRMYSPLRSSNNTLQVSPKRVDSPMRRTINTVDEGVISSSSRILTYEEEGFLDYLRLLLTAETEIEKCKNELAVKSDFNMEDAFCIFELEKRGYINNIDLKYGLNNYLNIFPSLNDIDVLIKRYGNSSNNTLR